LVATSEYLSWKDTVSGNCNIEKHFHRPAQQQLVGFASIQMCICFWWHSAEADCPIKLVLLFNRDEVLSRPSKPGKVDLRGPNYTPPAAYYGKDLTGGGTWLAVQEDGRFAAVLNNSAYSADPGVLKLLGIYALLAAVLYPVLPYVVLYVFLLPIYWYFATQMTQPPSRGKLPLEFTLGDCRDPKDFIKNHLVKV
jgi:hypothetical protein